jgi:hypothetical protein
MQHSAKVYGFTTENAEKAQRNRAGIRLAALGQAVMALLPPFGGFRYNSRVGMPPGGLIP